MNALERRRALLDAGTLLDLGRATFELARARLLLARERPNSFLTAQQEESGDTEPLSPAQAEVAERVAFAIPAMGATVPWKSDCLVQALAARRWLEGAGIKTSLFIGVRRGAIELDAHAWLYAGDRSVTGGDGGQYARIYGSAK